ncbi:LysR family transcriptional regulator [Rhodovibrionaceae bacterium A322]
MITLRNLRYLVAAANHQSVTLAAEAQNISQSAISAALAQLEAHYGQQIFVRHQGRGVSLTSFGQDLVSKARHLLNEAAELDGLGRGEGFLSGEVRIGCFAELTPLYVPALTKAFEALHPQVGVQVRESDFTELPRLLELGVIDMMIDYDVGLPEQIEKQLLTTLPPLLLLAADHPLAAQETVSLKQLVTEPLILTEDSQSRKQMLENFQRHGLLPTLAKPAGSLETLRSMVANGYGVSILHTNPAGNVSYDGLPVVLRPLADSAPSLEVLLVRHLRHPLSRAAEAFRAFTVDWFSQRKSQSG